MEKWKTISGFPKYEVSNLSNVRTVKNKRPLKQRLSFGDKYLKVALGAGIAGKSIPKRVHRLVALHFCKKIKGKDHVNHLDGNVRNNRWDNLEWVTQQENNYHSYHILGNKSPMLSKKGEAPTNKIMTPELLQQCISLREENVKTETIGKIVNLNGSTVRKHLRKHYGTNIYSVLGYSIKKDRIISTN